MDRVGARPENGHQARLLRLLRDRGQTSRADLGEAVGLSKSKVAVELDRLTELGLIESQGLAESRGGRRSHLVGLAGSLRFVGIDIGATSIDVAITDGELRLIAHAGVPSDVRRGPQVVLQEAVDLVAKLRADGAAEEVHGVGVGVPGPVSQREGAPVMPPIMPGWNRFPVRDTLSAALGAPVMVDNDVNIMALGELHAGTARSVEDFLFVKLGTGIGCGIIVDGRVYRGADGAAGDPVAVAVVHGGGRRLGLALASLVNFFNPGLVVIGGGVAGLGHRLLAEIRSVVYRKALPLGTGNLPIVLSELGGTAGVVGATRLVSDSVFSTT